MTSATTMTFLQYQGHRSEEVRQEIKVFSWPAASGQTSPSSAFRIPLTEGRERSRAQRITETVSLSVLVRFRRSAHRFGLASPKAGALTKLRYAPRARFYAGLTKGPESGSSPTADGPIQGPRPPVGRHPHADDDVRPGVKGGMPPEAEAARPIGPEPEVLLEHPPTTGPSAPGHVHHGRLEPRLAPRDVLGLLRPARGVPVGRSALDEPTDLPGAVPPGDRAQEDRLVRRVHRRRWGSERGGHRGIGRGRGRTAEGRARQDRPERDGDQDDPAHRPPAALREPDAETGSDPRPGGCIGTPARASDGGKAGVIDIERSRGRLREGTGGGRPFFPPPDRRYASTPRKERQEPDTLGAWPRGSNRRTSARFSGRTRV